MRIQKWFHEIEIIKIDWFYFRTKEHNKCIYIIDNYNYIDSNTGKFVINLLFKVRKCICNYIWIYPRRISAYPDAYRHKRIHKYALTI